MFELFFEMLDLSVLQSDTALHQFYVSVQFHLLLQQLLLFLVMFQLDPVYVLPVLLDQSSTVLTAPSIIFRHSPVLCGQTAVFALDSGHLVADVVQISLEPIFNFPGEIGTVGSNLLQVLLLFGTRDLEGVV